MTSTLPPVEPMHPRARAILLGAAVLLSIAAVSAYAHRLHAAITTVLFNDRTHRIEVMHRFNLHDAEHAATELFGRGADLLESGEDRQRFAIYVHERFSLGMPGGQRLPMPLIGSEIEGDTLWIYQAHAYPAEPLTGLIVAHSALQDIWPDQVNTVNLEQGGRVSTLTFRSGDPPRTATLQP